jgi:hypothetical protein
VRDLVFLYTYKTQRRNFASQLCRKIPFYICYPRVMKPCKVCVHEKRAEIESAILRHEPHARIGERTGLSLYSVYRHSKHLGRSIITKGKEPLLDRVEALMSRLERIGQRAESGKDWRACIAVMRELRESLMFIGRLTGEILPTGQGVHVNVAMAVTTGRQTHDLSDGDLDTRIAMEVAQATDNFDPATIERLRRLAQKSMPILTDCLVTNQKVY